MARRRRSPRARTRTTDALAVRIHDYAESSAVVVLLTAELGLVRAVAKGAKRISNSFRGPLDKAVLYRVRLGRRGQEGLHHLHTATVLEAYANVRRDVARFHVAALVLEVAADLMREDEPHDELFRLTAFVLKVLDRAPAARLGLVAAFFLARAVELTGHVPEIGHCVACGEELAPDDRPLISALRGGVLHPACGQGEPGTRSVSPATLDLLAAMWRHSSAEALSLEVPRSRLRDLRILLEEWLESVLERRFRAAAPMERQIRRQPAGVG
jgi:DNA repair protein RecO (recombination protein O)